MGALETEPVCQRLAMSASVIFDGRLSDMRTHWFISTLQLTFLRFHICFFAYLT